MTSANFNRLLRGLLAALAVALAAAGCSSDHTVGTDGLYYDLSGTYRSESEVPSLGNLELELALIEGTTWFDAVINTDLADSVEGSEGIATQGNLHLVINFDRGLLSDYYFEGVVTMTDDAIESLTGQFVFPDQAETMAVTFIPD